MSKVNDEYDVDYEIDDSIDPESDHFHFQSASSVNASPQTGRAVSSSSTGKNSSFSRKRKSSTSKAIDELTELAKKVARPLCSEDAITATPALELTTTEKALKLFTDNCATILPVRQRLKVRMALISD